MSIANGFRMCEYCGRLVLTANGIAQECYCQTLDPMVTMPCIECDTPVTFSSENPADPDAPYCAECFAEIDGGE